MTATVTRLPARPMTERQLQTAVLDLCRWFHLLAYHTHNSQHSARGFPDLIIVGSSILYRELKSGHGKVTIDQGVWRNAIRETGASWDVWRPEDWYSGRISAELEAICCKARGRS